MGFTAGQRIKALDFAGSSQFSEATAHLNIGTGGSFGSPNCSVTFTAPTSGAVVVTLGCMAQDDVQNNVVWLDFELRLNNSGGTVVVTTGPFERRLALPCPGAVGIVPNDSKMVTLTGLTPGQLYFLRTIHSANITGSADVFMRRIDTAPYFG